MLEKQELGAAIASAMKIKGISHTDLAQHFDVKVPSVYGWTKEGRIAKGKLPELFAYFSDVVGPEHWGIPSGSPLFAGTSQETNHPQVATEPSEDYVAIERVLLKVSAGVTGFQVEHLDGNGPPIFFRADWLASKGYKPERLFALRVSGESMEPHLYDGDLVIINAGDTTPRDHEVYVVNYEGEVLIKRLLRDAGEWWLASDNPRYQSKRCHEQALLLGRVIYRQTEHI